jgi:GT2 family glycosyltransferase
VSEPKVAIVIVTFNSKRFLKRQAEALQHQTEKRFEVIIFDNASPPDERPDPALAPPGARIVQSAINLGFAEGNNQAAKLTRAPYLAFLNPDAFPEPGWLAALLQAGETFPQAACFGSTQINAEHDDQYDGMGDVMFAPGVPYRSAYGKPLSQFTPTTCETFSACAAAMLMRADVFQEIGGFDPDFFCYCEDVDLGFRLRLQGWRVAQIGGAVVRHVGGGSSGAHSAFGDFHGARNRLWTFVKNMPAALFWPLLLPHLGVTFLILLSHALRGRGWHAARGVIAGVLGLQVVLQKRARIQKRATASWRDIAAALSWSPADLLGRRPAPRALKTSQARLPNPAADETG